MIRKITLPLFIVAALSSTANATTYFSPTQKTGYICQSAWVPNPAAVGSTLSNMGSYGAIYGYLFSEPNCGGEMVSFAYFCTTGATNTSLCATSSLLNVNQAQSLADSLQRAGATNQLVSFYEVGTAPYYGIGVWAEFTQP